MKKLVIIFVSTIMIMLFANSVSAKTIIDSGECGAESDNVTWVLYDDGELSVNGKGQIRNYNYSTSPLYNNKSIKKVSFSKGITNIGAYFLNQCENLENIILSDTVENIGNGSFSFCRNLSEIDVPKSVKYIGNYAFNYCDKLVNIKFHEGLEKVGDSAFSYCESLKNVILPNSVTTLGESAFSNSGLTSVHISNTLVSIGKKAFNCCYNIAEFIVDQNNPYYSSDENGILYNKEKTDLLQYPAGNSDKDVFIVDSVNNIWEYAFVNCDNILLISVPSSIKVINRMTFWLSDNIKLVNFRGTGEQWNNINIISEGNDCIFKAKIHTFNHKVESRFIEANCIEPKILIEFCVECEENISESVADDKLGQHTTTNGKCDKCKAFIVEQGVSIELQCTTNSDGSWIGATDVFNITETGKSTVSVGGYYSCTHYVTIKALKIGEADLYLVASNNAILSQSKIIVLGHTHYYTLSTKIATCIETGTKTYTCSCGDIYTETIPATNHANATTDAGKAPTTTEVGYTAGKYCPDCKTWVEGHEEISMLHTHSYSVTVSKITTCITTGTKTYICSCGDTYTEIIPATNHANATTDAGKSPTTTEVGYTAGKYCPDCKTWIEGHEEIPMLHTHSYSVTVNKTATCTTAGTTTFTCACGDTYTETIPATNHPNATTDAGKAPTTTEVGYTAGKYCPDCKTWLEGHEVIPMLHTHKYTSSVTEQDTCASAGTKTYTCTCGDTYTETIAKLSHENETQTTKATLTKNGGYKVICKNCGQISGEGVYYSPEIIELKTTKYTYDGKAKKPAVLIEDKMGVDLKEGTDYKLTYASGRKNPGKYSVKITFMGNYSGTKTLYFTILPGKTSKVTATQSTDSIKLSWKKVSGATGYRVYQYNSKTGKYEKIKTLTGTSYTVKKLKAGTSYKFAVKAYTKADGETLWANSSVTFKTATKPATPTVKATAGTGKVTLSWSKVSGATGYVIYMKNSSGEFKKVATTKNLKYTVSNLDNGKKYYFRVRAYKTVDGTNIYGDFKTVNATTLYPAVYVTPYGKRYHYDKECAGKNATKTTLADAKKTRTPCKTCVL